MTTLVDRVLAVAQSLEGAQLPWAFGGALALAYATEEPRGTRDIDVNVFVPTDQAGEVFARLPPDVRHTHDDVTTAAQTGQVRLWWDDTPIDVFFAEHTFHHDAHRRCRRVPFAGTTISVLCAEDLAVFKAMLDRPKDWVDIATMVEADAIDLAVAADRLRLRLGDDPRVDRLRTIT